MPKLGVNAGNVTASDAHVASVAARPSTCSITKSAWRASRTRTRRRARTSPPSSTIGAKSTTDTRPPGIAPGVVRQSDARATYPTTPKSRATVGSSQPVASSRSAHQRVVTTDLDDFLEIRGNALDFGGDAARAGLDRHAAQHNRATHQAAACKLLVEPEDALAQPHAVRLTDWETGVRDDGAHVCNVSCTAARARGARRAMPSVRPECPRRRATRRPDRTPQHVPPSYRLRPALRQGKTPSAMRRRRSQPFLSLCG